MTGAREVRAFAIRRVFRIVPLLALVTLATLAPAREWPPPVPVSDLLLNVTGLFGFVRPDHYIATGAWTLGNEMTYYVLFPALVLLAVRGHRVLLWLVAGAVAVPFVWFTFWGLDPAESLASQWSLFVHPLNHVGAFAAGFLVGELSGRISLGQKAWWAVLAGAGLAYALVPAAGDQIVVMTGWRRVALTLASIAVCAAAYKITARIPSALHRPLATLGLASYSLYLLHPLVWRTVEEFTSGWLSAEERVAICMPLALFASWVSWKLVEIPSNRLGHRLATRIA